MLRTADRQRNFFDDAIFARMIPPDHPLVAIDRAVDFSFVDTDVHALYSPDQGRPSYPPEMLFRALYLGIWGNLSDVQVAQQLRFNVLFRWFCRIGWDDPVPDDTTLVVFRRRLKASGVYDRLLDRAVAQAKAKGLAQGRWMIVDGTKVAADVAIRNQLELVREGRKRLLRALRRARPDKADALAAWAEPLADTDYPDRDALLAAEMAKGEALFEQLDDVADAEADRLKAQYRAVLNGEGVASFTDPEARWGFQKKGEAFLGYKVVASCDEHGLVTAVTVAPGNESEVAQVKTLRAKWKRLRLRPRALAADKAYDASTLRQELDDQGVRIYTPRKYRRRTLPTGFTHDRRKNQVICPAGTIGQASPHPNGGFLHVFSQRTCQRCSWKAQCLKAGQKRQVIYFHPGKDRDRPRGIRVAMRVRKTIERVFGEAKKWHRLDRARYRGRLGVAFQTVMTFFVLNTKKLSRWRAPEAALKTA